MKLNKKEKKEYEKKRYRDNIEYITGYRTSERGYMKRLWQSVRDSKQSHSFPIFEDFYNHWLEQKKIHGMTCPGTGIEMTMKALFNEKGKYKRCLTNISKDRILNDRGYDKQNLIFTSWNYNKIKGSLTVKMAKTFLKIVKERYGDKNETQ
jgi:hypothetical protein